VVKVCKFLSLVVALMLCLPAIAQNTTGTINGRILDPQGAVVGGADVTVTSTTTNVAHAVKTNQDGLYTVPLLQPGTYSVSVVTPSFRKEIRNNITLQIQQTLDLDFSLSVGATTETVTVSTAVPLVSTQSAAIGTVIDNRKVLEIPLNGREFYDLAPLVPGAMPPVIASSLSYRGGFNVAGQPETSNYDTLDGINNLDAAVSSPNVRPSVENIQEFNLVTGEYEAEYGHNIGGQLVVTTKSGGNAFHGDVYEFLRNQLFDAKNYFQSPTSKLSLKRNDFGGTFGGPIIRNKMFFFFSTEILRLSNQYSQLSTIPTSTQIGGTFAGHLTTPLNYNPSAFVYNAGTNTTTINPGLLTGTSTAPTESGQLGAYTVGAALLAFYPADNTTGGSNYPYSAPNREDSELYELRIDNAINAKNSTYVTLHWFNDPVFTPNNPTCGSANIPGFICFAGYRSQLYGGGWTHIFTSNVINNLVAGFQRLNVPRNTVTSFNFDAAYGIPAWQGPPNPLVTNGEPEENILGYSTYSDEGPQNRYDNTYDYSDSLLWNKGSHSFKFGGEYTRLLDTLLVTSNPRGEFIFNGTYTGNPVADALLGLPTEAEVGPTAPIIHDKQTYIGVYAQDSWKALPNLTINYGIRWEAEPPSTAANAPQIVEFVPANGISCSVNCTGEPYIAGTNGTPRHAWHADNGGWGPRLGVAYRPFKNDNTVIQAGFAITYDVSYVLQEFLGTQDTFPDVSQQTFIGTTAAPLSLPNPFANNGTTALNTYGTSPNFPIPRNVGYSFGVEQKLTSSTVLTLTYQGSETAHEFQTYNINQTNVLQTPVLSAAAGIAARPYSQWNTITWATDRGHASYNAFYAKLQQSLSHGLSYLVSYTWGKAEDDSEQEGGTVQNIYNFKAEKGLSAFNVPQRIVASPVYQLPFGTGRQFLNQGWSSKVVGGWEVASEISYQKGTQTTPIDGANVSNNGETSGDRPYVQGNPNKGAPRTVNEWFNTLDYNYQNVVSGVPTNPTIQTQLNSFPGTTVVPATPEPYGNARHGSINNPNYADVDVNIARNFPLPRRMSMQFRAEMFNAFNHPNFNPPGATFTGFTKNATTGVVSAAGSFGHLTAAQDGRDVQFALKLFF
jgi:hypothetical protein